MKIPALQRRPQPPFALNHHVQVDKWEQQKPSPSNYTLTVFKLLSPLTF
jgi:hypothetical protein